MARTTTNPRIESMRLSMDPQTKQRLQAYAAQLHTSVSQMVTDWIWSQPVKDDTSTSATGVEKK